jgi:hypothetical protein
MRNLPANSELVKDPITLIWFTQATAGMDINQFYAYSGYYALHSIRIVSRSPEEVARAVKSFKDRDELSLVSEFLYDCSINTKKMKEYVARAKLLVTPEFTFEELRSILNRFSDKSGRALYMLERLDEDYIKNWLKIMMKNLPDYVEKIDFDALNSLKPCQREALRFLEESQYVYTNAESVVNIFNPLIKSFGNISNEYEAIYVGRNIDSGSYFPGQAVQDAASHAAVWKAMADAGIPKDFDSSLLSNLFSKGIPDDVIIKILGDLSKLSDDGQKAVFRKYVN